MLHRVNVYKNLLEKRQIRNNMMQSFAKKQHELISLQSNYNSSQQIGSDNPGDYGLLKELKQELTQLKSLKENIESFISSKPIFTDQASLRHLIGQIVTPEDTQNVESSLAKDQTAQTKTGSKLNLTSAPASIWSYLKIETVWFSCLRSKPPKVITSGMYCRPG